MMLTVEERLRLCHQGTAWHGDLIKKQLTELAELLAASERSDAESLAMYHSARERADHLQREIDEIKQTEFPRRVEKVAGVLHAKVKQLTEAELVMRRNAAEWQTEAKGCVRRWPTACDISGSTLIPRLRASTLRLLKPPKCCLLNTLR